MIQFDERDPDHQADQQALQHKQDQLCQCFHIGRSVHSRQRLTHCRNGIGEWEKDIYFLISIRQQFNRERAAGSRDLQYHDNDADSLTHISECQCQRIDQQGKCSCRKACRQEKQCRLHDIDLQQPQISRYDNGCLNLCQQEKQQISAEIQLITLYIFQSFRRGFYFHQCHQYRRPYPDGQCRIKRSHSRSVGGHGIHGNGLHGHRRCKISSQAIRVTAQETHQNIHHLFFGSTLQLIRQVCQFVADAVYHALNLAKAFTGSVHCVTYAFHDHTHIFDRITQSIYQSGHLIQGICHIGQYSLHLRYQVIFINALHIAYIIFAAVDNALQVIHGIVDIDFCLLRRLLIRSFQHTAHHGVHHIQFLLHCFQRLNSRVGSRTSSITADTCVTSGDRSIPSGDAAL